MIGQELFQFQNTQRTPIRSNSPTVQSTVHYLFTVVIKAFVYSESHSYVGTIESLVVNLNNEKV